MTIQDLTDNRDRIIKNINFQSKSKGAIVGIMNKMVARLISNSNLQAQKATMGNIDKLTRSCTESWIKYDDKTVYSKNENDEFNEKRRLENLPSSCRA